MSARNKWQHPRFQKLWQASGAVQTAGLTPIAHDDFRLMHGIVRKVKMKWPVLELRGARTGFDERGRPVSNWGCSVPKLEVRSAKMAYHLPSTGVTRLERTYIVEVHYLEAENFHCHEMTHPMGASGSMIVFDFIERAQAALKEFLTANKMRQVSDELAIPFVRVIAESIPMAA